MMGSMGMHNIDYKSVKAGATEGSELICWGSLQRTGNQIRYMATDCKAVIAMARDPIEVSWCLDHGAPGAITQAINLGKAYNGAKKGEPAVKAAARFLGGQLIEHGEITSIKNEAKGGYDVGTMTIKGEKTWEMSYVNEYMTLETSGKRVSTYPDLMATFDAHGVPINSTTLRQGDKVYVITAPKENLKVGDGNKYLEIYEPIEAALGKPLVTYLKGYLKS